MDDSNRDIPSVGPDAAAVARSSSDPAASELGVTFGASALLLALLEALRGFLERGQPPVEPVEPGDLGRVIAELPVPAYLVSDGGVLLFANDRALQQHGAKPPWLGDGATLPQGVWQLSLAKPGSCCRVLIDSAGHPAQATEPAWARRWRLPPRQVEIAQRIAGGLSDREIAQELGLAHNTVRTYVRQIYRRAGVHSRTELVRGIYRLR